MIGAICAGKYCILEDLGKQWSKASWSQYGLQFKIQSLYSKIVQKGRQKTKCTNQNLQIYEYGASENFNEIF